MEPVQRACAEERPNKASKGIIIKLLITLHQIYLSLTPLARLTLYGYGSAKVCYHLEQ